MIQLNKRPTDRILELGGGANPHPKTDVRVDVRFCNTPDGKPCVDFTADFNEPLPIKDGDFDGVYSHFALEHVSWRKVPQLVGESFRVLKPGGRAVFVVPNTEAQLKWVQDHPQGWDGKNLFESASCILYGDLDYPENSHRAYFSPTIAKELFLAAGFKEVEVYPYGPRETDMVIVATKFAINQQIPTTVKLADDVPKELLPTYAPVAQMGQEHAPGKREDAAGQPGGSVQPPDLGNPKQPGAPTVSNKSDDTVEVHYPENEKQTALTVSSYGQENSSERAKLFDRFYWDGGSKVGGYAYDRWGTAYRDFPCHELTARHVLYRKPESVLELGCLVEGSPIVTKEGVVAIEELDDGMEVYTHEGQFAKIARRSVRPYVGDIIVVEPRYSRNVPLRLTPDHPVYAIRVSRKSASWKPEIVGKPEWVAAGELRKETYWLVIPRPKKTSELELDEGYARLCGYYLADGWGQKKNNGVSTGYTVSFCLRKEKYNKYGDDIREQMKRHFGTTDGWVEGEDRAAVKLCFYSKLGYSQLTATFGKGARNKSIPMEWVTGATDKVLRQLILGMYRGDGTYPKNDRFSYKTSSINLAMSLRLALLRLGVVTEFAECPPRESVIRERVIIGGMSYEVRATGVHYDGFASITGDSPRVRKDGRAYWYGRMDDDNVYIPIKRLSKENYVGSVYNMDVVDDHSYSHPVCTVHNCARGYVLKRIQDAGIKAWGIEISKHCYLTRACEDIWNWDICLTPWSKVDNPVRIADRHFDLCFSIAVLEHVPEQYLPAVIGEMKRTCKRGLHGVDFGERDDGFDKTHSTLKPREWWLEQFVKYAPGWPVEIVDKETLEQIHPEIVPEYPREVIQGDGKLKLNIGSFTVMSYYGWTNIDIANCQEFADHNRYNFLRHDVRQGLPFGTGTVDLISSSHFLEHLNANEGLKFLRECRRVIKPQGAIRIGVPDAGLLMRMYMTGDGQLAQFAEINDGVANAKTDAQRLWALLHENHSQVIDWETMEVMLKDTGFKPSRAEFRRAAYAGTEQIVRECEVLFPDLTLIADAVPLT